MSYEVKPEDVPEDMHEICDGMLEPKHIASVINAAIDLELVSPPCFCVRQNGELRKFDSGEIKVFSGNPWAHDTEHWKGQTE